LFFKTQLIFFKVENLNSPEYFNDLMERLLLKPFFFVFETLKTLDSRYTDAGLNMTQKFSFNVAWRR
jgi:hypothetical protein